VILSGCWDTCTSGLSLVPMSSHYLRNQRLATASIARTGPPTLFITLTFNPYCPKLQRELNGQPWIHQPDLVMRLFNLQKTALLQDLRTGRIFSRLDRRHPDDHVEVD